MSINKVVYSNAGYPMNGAQMKDRMVLGLVARTVRRLPSILLLGAFLIGCEQRSVQPPPPDIRDDDQAVKVSTALLATAERSHQWTPEQDKEFSHNLSGLSGKTRVELTLRLVNLINMQQVKRIPDKGDPEPPPVCPSPCPTTSSQDNPDQKNPSAGGLRPAPSGKHAR